MMIGIVVEVLDEEHKKMEAENESKNNVVAEEFNEIQNHEQKMQAEIALLHQKLDTLLAQQSLNK